MTKSTPLSSLIYEALKPDFGVFMENAVKRGELAEMPFELYWAIGFTPLYALIEFHVTSGSYANDRFGIKRGDRGG